MATTTRARARALVLIVVVAGLVLAGCGTSPKEPPRAKATARLSADGPRSAGPACDGIRYRGVLGPRPGYGLRGLRQYPARRYTCRAFWLRHTGSGFVPQSLALAPKLRTAWVSGYKWMPDVGDRACRLMRVDLRTGRTLVDQGRIVGAPKGRRATFCRHGGGLALDRHGLWLAEKERLWLLDPAEVGVHPRRAVKRVWSIRAPVYGSTVVAHNGLIGLGHFRKQADSGLSWFRIRDLLARGAADLVGRAREDGEVARAGTRRIPGYVQGMTWRYGLVVTASRPGCGQLVTSGERRLGVLRGIEDVEFTGHDRVWVVSESSAKVYQAADRRLTPMLSEYDASKVLGLRGPGRC